MVGEKEKYEIQISVSISQVFSEAPACLFISILSTAALLYDSRVEQEVKRLYDTYDYSP